MKKVTLIVVGTELTHGIIEDKHTAVVARECSHLGLNFRESILVADDGTINEVLSSAIEENDLVIITGGLGPTSDDMTRSSIAETAGCELVRNENVWALLLETLKERAYGANEKQAYIPRGFEVIPNPNGTAPGFWGKKNSTLIVALPGPPREMRPMFYDSVIPLLVSFFGLEKEEREEYSVYSLAEAKLEELTKKADSTLSWGTRFQDYKISLYVSGKDRNERERAVEKLSLLIGKRRVEKGDVSALEGLVNTLKEKSATVAAAESCTGGLASSLLTSLPGSSTYMLGGVVSYAVSVKKSLLGVPDETVLKYGVVSNECALEMAEGVRRAVKSDYSFSITGVAGPDKSEDKDVGTVSFGFSGKERKSEALTLHLPSWGRESIRRRACVIAFILMRAFIEGEDIHSIVESWKAF